MRPKIYREIFENDGAGPLIRDDILPAASGGTGGGEVTTAQLQAVANRVTVNEGDIADLKTNVTTNEANISGLQSEATAKWVILNNVQAYQTGTVAPFITTTNTRLDTIESAGIGGGDVTTAQLQAVADRVTVTESDITNLKAADIALGTRIDAGNQIMLVEDQKESSVHGGTFTNGAWRSRDLNTVLVNTIVGATLQNNQITLPPGTYDVSAKAPAYGVGKNVAILADSANNLLLTGTSAFSYTVYPSQVTSDILGRIVLVTSTVIQVLHLGEQTLATNGFGISHYMSSTYAPLVNNVYTRILIRKVA